MEELIKGYNEEKIVLAKGLLEASQNEAYLIQSRMREIDSVLLQLVKDVPTPPPHTM